jgi:shikimate dehydrogenase
VSKPPITGIRAEVWGSPIGHSRSPELHRACYAHLNIPHFYDRREVIDAELASAFASHSGTLDAISLTMPLKTPILNLVSDHRGDVDLLQAANTAVKSEGTWWLTNTDPLGAAAMLRRLLPDTRSGVVVLGAGATAKSIVLGLHHVAFTGHLTIVVRSTDRATGLHELADTLGISHTVVGFDHPGDLSGVGLMISTLPSGTTVPEGLLVALGALGSPFMDVGYHPWPTPLAEAFLRHGLDAHSGLPMLMFQALGQIRAVVNGDTDQALPDEKGALQAMADAVGLDGVWVNPALMGQ